MREFLEQFGIDEETANRIIDKHDEEMKQQQLAYSVKEELSKNGVTDMQAAVALLKGETLCEDSLEDIIKKFASEHPSLFENRLPVRIVSGASAAEENDKSSFEKMSYMQRLQLFRTNPELYQKLL